MPFIGNVTVIAGGLPGTGTGYPDINPEDGIIDEANRITLDGVTVEPQQVIDNDDDIADLELIKMNKTDPVDGGGF